MTCRVALCAVCRLAGLSGCPARGARLPLAEAERTKVIYRGYLHVSDAGQRIVWTKAQDPTRWDVE